MKKLWIAFAIAMVAVMLIASPALAWGGSGADADVDCGDIDVTNDSPVIGTTITFYGTVTITAEAYTRGLGSMASASSAAYYVIRDPEGNIVAQDFSNLSDCDLGLFCARADASQIFDWSCDVYINLIGDYIAEHGGSAEAFYLTVFPTRLGCDCDSCSTSRTVTSSALTAAASHIHPYLVINLPDGSRHFYGSDGWGNPTSREIAYTDGTWQVEIQDGTAIQMDGTWHKTTYLDVDDQGNVTGRYGAGGSTVAEEIGLSQPITITKVG
jgi:hypothetical protein